MTLNSAICRFCFAPTFIFSRSARHLLQRNFPSASPTESIYRTNFRAYPQFASANIVCHGRIRNNLPQCGLGLKSNRLWSGEFGRQLTTCGPADSRNFRVGVAVWAAAPSCCRCRAFPSPPFIFASRLTCGDGSFSKCECKSVRRLCNCHLRDAAESSPSSRNRERP